MEGYSRADPASADLRLVRAFGASAGRWVTGRQFVHNPVLNKAQVPIAGGTFLAPLSWGIGGQAALFHSRVPLRPMREPLQQRKSPRTDSSAPVARPGLWPGFDECPENPRSEAHVPCDAAEQ